MAEAHPFFVDITACGAVGDGRTLNTAAIQQALDQVGAAGGGTVFVPPGTYLTSTIELRSGVTLNLHPAARLLGSPKLSDYATKQWGQHGDRTPWHLLMASGVHDVTVTGGGTIDGNGPAFWEETVAGPHAVKGTYVPPGAFKGLDPITVVAAHEQDPRKSPITWIRPHVEKRPSPMVEITGCQDVRLLDVHLTNSAGWVLHLHNCDRVWVRGVKLTANLGGPNNDGFDITGCRDVMVSDCAISCCDDAICLKTTPDARSCERITVTNCVIRTRCAALKFGCSESFHDFRQVTFTNCVVYESNRAIGIYTKAGGTVEDVTISNIVCDTRLPYMMNRPIHIDCRRERPEYRLGKIRNVLISNVIIRTDGRILITSQPESPIENLVLRDIQMVYPTVDDPTLSAARIKCAQFSNDNPDARAARAAVVAEHVDGLVLDNLMVAWPKVDAQGLIQCPPEWNFPLKAVNGDFLHFERPKFNTGRVPDFHVLWGRGLRGGYVRAPLAAPPRAGIAAYALEKSDIKVV